MHAIVRKTDNTVIGTVHSLPSRFRIDGGTTIDFSAPGGLETADYICLPVEDQAAPEPRTHRRAGAPSLARDGAVVRRTWAIEAISLAEVRAAAKARLGVARLRQESVVTAGPDATPEKLALYANKFNLALNVAVLGNTGFPGAETFFVDELRPEATALGMTPEALASVILAKGVTARPKVATIEGHYATASSLIAAAATAADIIAAEDAGTAAIEAVT